MDQLITQCRAHITAEEAALREQGFTEAEVTRALEPQRTFLAGLEDEQAMRREE